MAHDFPDGGENRDRMLPSDEVTPDSQCFDRKTIRTCEHLRHLPPKLLFGTSDQYELHFDLLFSFKGTWVVS